MANNKLKATLIGLALSTSMAEAAGISDTDPNFRSDASSGLEYAAIGDTQSPQKILVLLHGAGDNYKPLASLGENVATQYDNLLILVPNGPVKVEDLLPASQIEDTKKQNPNLNLDNMRNWTDMGRILGEGTYEEIQPLLVQKHIDAANSLNTLIGSQLDLYGLQENDVSLYGFSAGGALAMYAGLQADRAYAEILNHSGTFYGYGPSNPNSTPPISILVGALEPQLIEALPMMVRDLESKNVQVTYDILENTGHGVSSEVIDHFYGLIDNLVESSELPDQRFDHPKP